MVVRAFADGLQLADGSLALEAPGLTSTSQRPADILTNAALPRRSAALDVTVVSADAAGAGDDACATAFEGKINKYRRIISELNRAGIAFRPLVWSSEGRPHPAVRRTMSYASGIASRKLFSSASAIRKRWEHEIAVAIQRRRAAMVRACLPSVRARHVWIGTGHVDHDAPRMQNESHKLDPL